MRYVERDWQRFQEYDTLLLDCSCGVYCLTRADRWAHHKQTGHAPPEFCGAVNSKTKRRCQRLKGHDGIHAYPGYSYVVDWRA